MCGRVVQGCHLFRHSGGVRFYDVYLGIYDRCRVCMVGEYSLRYEYGYTGSSALFGWLGWPCWVCVFIYYLGDQVVSHGEMVMSMAALAQAKPLPRLLSFVEGAWVEASCAYRVVKLFRVEQGPIFHFLAGTGVRVCMSFSDYDRLLLYPQYITVFLSLLICGYCGILVVYPMCICERRMRG